MTGNTALRKLYFLLPGTTRQFYCGGLFAELKALELAQQVCPAEAVTYRQREAEHPFLDDLLAQGDLTDCIFVLSWGFDVAKQLQRLGHCHVMYHAHSAGYGFRVPARVPIATVSRNTMGYWGATSPNTLLYWWPNCLDEAVTNRQQTRDIDVLVQARKSSEYLMTQLVPALKTRCNVTVIDHFVDDLIGLFNRSKIYLYDSVDYWTQNQLTEGFGLPPMEALACGCQVFSSVNHALADYLDPGVNCAKIAGYATGYDVQRIETALDNWQPNPLDETFFWPYRQAQVQRRLETILAEVNQFFDYQSAHGSDIAELTSRRKAYLQWRRWQNKLTAKIRAKLLP